jgi:hypothetical protein
VIKEGGFMKKTINPHPKLIRDEDTGIAIPNKRYDDWESGYKSGIADAVCAGFYNIAAAFIHKNRESYSITDKRNPNTETCLKRHVSSDRKLTD